MNFLPRGITIRLDGYLNALKNSVGSGKSVRDFIQRRLDILETRMDMNEFMRLGDSLFNANDFDAAEGMYLKAGERASEMHDSDWREKAYAALEKVYNKRAQLRKEATDKMNDQKQVAVSDALKKGEQAALSKKIEHMKKSMAKGHLFDSSFMAKTEDFYSLDRKCPYCGAKQPNKGVRVEYDWNGR